MFGDIGHGGVLLLVGSMLCLFSDKLKIVGAGNGALMGLVQCRYIFLLMGLFAFYCGIIYNDFIAIPLWLFDSCYPLTYLPKKADINDHEAWEEEHQGFTTS
jgi:V-type H+-transporting ATPase subunit a